MHARVRVLGGGRRGFLHAYPQPICGCFWCISGLDTSSVELLSKCWLRAVSSVAPSQHPCTCSACCGQPSQRSWLASTMQRCVLSNRILLLLPLLSHLQAPKSARGCSPTCTMPVSQVPRHYYQFSCAAFATAVCINCLALVYEISPLKKQAAVIQILIKGMSTFVDYQLGYGQPLMIMGTRGAV